jgi:hypothetical protein
VSLERYGTGNSIPTKINNNENENSSGLGKGLLSRASIHKACLGKKTDVKVVSLQTLFEGAFLSVYRLVP